MKHRKLYMIEEDPRNRQTRKIQQGEGYEKHVEKTTTTTEEHVRIYIN